MSCNSKNTKVSTSLKDITVLPFKTLDLNDLSTFKPTSDNWDIVESVVVDRTQEKTFDYTSGHGVLLNIPKGDEKKNIFTQLEHGDIELEIDVMMPVNSNSGIYLQGRYEVQLFDSWGVQNPKYNDMGGIYQRWNKNTKTGYEGHAPKINASKSPGLWQHFKIIFHAPKFDLKGNKIKNAWFEEVRLNGEIIQKNIELTGPTRAGLKKEVALGSLMLQGDHGPVAFKNIRYKLYENKKIGIENTTLTVYENKNKSYIIDNMNNLVKTEEIKVDSISPLARFASRTTNITEYKGTFNIPNAGDYLFNINVNGGSLLIINNDTIINMNANFNSNTQKYNTINLPKGKANYTLIYNKPSPWARNFNVYVEGPNIQRYSLLKTSMFDLNKHRNPKTIVVKTKQKTKLQRGFMIHRGNIKTHAISIGLKSHLNYSLDLATGSLLHFWSGDFLNTTDMWHSRGKKQMAVPLGFTIASHGELDFHFLEIEHQEWPKTLNKSINFKQIQYELIDDMPVFTFRQNGATITNSIKSLANSKRGLTRTLTINTKKTIWHKIADGENIRNIYGSTYIINDESYFIDFPENNTLSPLIRTINGKQELLVKVPEGNNTLNYNIIW